MIARLPFLRPFPFHSSIHFLAAAPEWAEHIHSHQATKTLGLVTLGTSSQQQNPQEPYIPRQPLRKESHGHNSDKMTLLPESWLSPSPSAPSHRWTH